jgi:hypothetical protein
MQYNNDAYQGRSETVWYNYESYESLRLNLFTKIRVFSRGFRRTNRRTTVKTTSLPSNSLEH